MICSFFLHIYDIFWQVICANSEKKQAANMYLCTRGSSPDLRKRSLFKSCFHTNHRDHGSQDEKGGEQWRDPKCGGRHLTVLVVGAWIYKKIYMDFSKLLQKGGEQRRGPTGRPLTLHSDAHSLARWASDLSTLHFLFCFSSGFVRRSRFYFHFLPPSTEDRLLNLNRLFKPSNEYFWLQRNSAAFNN